MTPRHLLLPALTLACLGGCDLAGTLRGLADGLDGGGDDGTPARSLQPGQTAPVSEKKPSFFRKGTTLPQPDAPISRSECSTLDNGGPTDGCLTAEVHCGETIVGHTLGGTRAFDTQFYVDKMCTPDTTDHNGGDERVYKLTMPDGDWRAVVTLDTPCADLDLAAMTWNEPSCPGPASAVNRCEMWPKPGNEREQVLLVSQRETTWLLVVEGKDAEEGAFGLSVQCFPGLH